MFGEGVTEEVGSHDRISGFSNDGMIDLMSSEGSCGETAGGKGADMSLRLHLVLFI